MAGLGVGTLPVGLGWFVQPVEGQRVVWHFGVVPDAYSSLIVKIPDRDVTLILLANSDGLVAPYQLPLGDVTATQAVGRTTHSGTDRQRRPATQNR